MAVAQYSNSYLNRSPYLTAEEFLNAPTGVDTTNLVPNGNQAAQNAQLANVIYRASSIMDNYVYGTLGSLTATQNTEMGRARITKSGLIQIRPLYQPILEVKSLQIAYDPTLWQTVDLTNIIIEPSSFIVSGGLTTSAGALSLGFSYSGSQLFTQFVYVNGWANTILSASVAALATTITPTSVVGMYANTLLSIYDGASDEQIQIGSSYVEGNAVVPLSTPLA